MKRLHRMVYLAGPYSHPVKRIRQRRNDRLTEISARLFEAGFINYSPITHSHAQQDYLSNADTGFDHWRKNDIAFLSRCDEIWVALISGWDKSYGVREELKFAKENGIVIRYIHINKSSLVVTDSHDDTGLSTATHIIEGE